MCFIPGFYRLDYSFYIHEINESLIASSKKYTDDTVIVGSPSDTRMQQKLIGRMYRMNSEDFV